MYYCQNKQEKGSVSIEIVIVLPMIIYLTLLVFGCLQLAYTVSLLGFNTSYALHSVNAQDIVSGDSYSKITDVFYNNITKDIDKNVIKLERKDVEMKCYKLLQDVINNRYLTCDISNLKQSKVISFEFKYTVVGFSSIFSLIYPDEFSNVSKRILMPNDIFI